jgi:hypothetical protein
MPRNRAIWPLLAVVLSCHGSTETGVRSEPMTLTFEPATATRTGTRIANVGFRCDVDMTILAHGTSDHLITLGAITSTFYDSTGAEGNTLHSSPADWFGVITMRRDDTAVAHRQPTGSGPFSLTNSIAYVDQFGTSKVATFMLQCTK